MPITDWQSAFVATALIEIPIVAAATRSGGQSAWKRVATAFVAQLLTHPVVWFVFPRIAWLSPASSLWLSEIWAWLIEAGVYAAALSGVPALRALALSAVANGASLGLGVMAGVCGAR